MEIKRNLEIKKSYTVDGVEYSSKEDALKVLATSTLKKLIAEGVDSVIENHADFIKALRIIRPALGTTELPAPKPGRSGTLQGLDWEMSKQGMRIVRSKVSWPVYHIFLADKSEKVITFKQEVWALYNLFEKEGIEGLLKHQNS